MARKIVLIFVAVLLVSMLAVSVSAAPTLEKHCICGDMTCAGTGTNHKTVTWSAWDGSTTPTSGYYYLTRDVTLSTPLVPAAGSSLGTKVLGIDLNGHTLSSTGLRVFQMSNSYSRIILTDSSAAKTGTVEYTQVSGGESYGFGVRMHAARTTFDMYGGTITGTKYAGTGGAAVLLGSGSNATTTVFNLYGGRIAGGTGAKGGNVFIHVGTFNMHGGTICDGVAPFYGEGLGGNVFLNDLGNNGGAVFHMYGGTISGGTAVQGANIYARQKSKVTISGGRITGAREASDTGSVHMDENSTLTLSGTPYIYDSLGSNLYLPAGKTVTVSGTLSAGACVGVTLADYTDFTTSSRAFVTSNGSANAGAFRGDLQDQTVYVSGSSLMLKVSGNCRINGTGTLQYFDKALENADFSKNDFIQLQSNLNVVQITKDTCIDLNGHNINYATISTGATLYVFDSTTDGYSGENAGVIQRIAGSGKLAPTCLRNNRRYLTLKESGGYSFHRFYLSVTHAVLAPGSNSLRFKLKLHCSERLAQAITEFGIQLQVNGNRYLDENGSGNIPIAQYTVAAGENTALVQTVGAISKDPKGYMDAAQGICAYIQVGDSCITSAVKTQSMRQVMLQVIDTQWDCLSARQQNAMADIYRRYGEAAQMDSWGDGITQKVKPLAVKETTYACVCGDPNSTENPCAQAGHTAVPWTEWKGPELPTVSGYYRLVKDIFATQAAQIPANNHVVLDLNGHTVRQRTAGTSIYKLLKSNARLTLTDHAGGGTLIPVSCTENGTYGMTIDVSNATAVYTMYGGVLDCTGKESRYGVGIHLWKGMAYMYGGLITGGHSTGMGGGGGNVIVNNNTTFTMYGGIIENGTTYDATATDYKGGGNLRILAGGTFTMYGGIIQGGVAQRNTGGNINNQGTARIYGGIIRGGSAVGAGGGIYNAATLEIAGDPVIADNEKSDVYLVSGKPIVLGSAGMQSGARVGIYTAATTDNFTTAANATAANAAYFFSNRNRYSVGVAGSEGLFLGSSSYCVGYGEADLSPTEDLFGVVGLIGYDNHATRKVTAVDASNPLKAICVAVSDGRGDTVLLISVDSGAVSGSIHSKVAAYAQSRHEIGQSRVMLSSNHQHSSPAFTDGYQTLALAQIYAAIDQAMADMQPITAMESMTVNVGANQFNFVRNYQYLDAAGNVIAGAMSTPNHDDKNRADIAAIIAGKTYESTADCNVPLLRIRRQGKKDILLMNFQTHPILYTSGSSTVAHADVVGRVRNSMNAKLGCNTVYFNGAGGNIQVYSDVESGKRRADMLTNNYPDRLADAVIRGINSGAWANAVGTATPYVTTLTQVCSLDVRLNADGIPAWLRSANTSFANATDAQILAAVEARARQLHTGSSTTDVAWTASDVQQYGIYSIYHAKHIVQRISAAAGQTTDKTVSAIAFGDVAFAVASYEMFDTNGVQIKNESPFGITFIATMAAVPKDGTASGIGVSGYIPSMLAYENGGYSTDITHFAAGSGEKLADNFVDMLHALHP